MRRPIARAVVVLAVVAFCSIIFHLSAFSSLAGTRIPFTGAPSRKNSNGGATSNASTATHGNQPNLIQDPNLPPCASLPNTEGIVVVMRTGATEIADKLPAHLNTTFTCYPDVIVFSDYGEVFGGVEVHDVLAGVAQDVREQNEDFEIWRRLRESGHAALRAEELSGTEASEGGKGGKVENKGWKLDKWKFLPMMQRTLELRPSGKVFIFIETDTYLVTSNMYQWLATLPSQNPLYFGSEVMIGDDLFAHGGSAFVLTKPAVEAAAREYAANTAYWNDRTNDHWAGDCMLGIVLQAVGVDLTFAWPMLQGGSPRDIDWEESKNAKLWCAPVLSYHHIDADKVHALWEFEQHWILDSQSSVSNQWSGSKDVVLHHRDMFREYVLPIIRTVQEGWDNMSRDWKHNTEVPSMERCRALCLADLHCFQYAMSEEDGCATSRKVVGGEGGKRGMKSGWMVERVEEWMKGLDDCRAQGWTVP